MSRILRDREARGQPYCPLSIRADGILRARQIPLPMLRFMDISGARAVPARRVRHRGGPMGQRKIATAGRRRHGQRQRLGHHAPRGRPARCVRRRVRGPRAFGAPDARRHARVRGRRAARAACAASSPAPAARRICPACSPRRRRCRCSACRCRRNTCAARIRCYSIVQMPKGIPVATFAIGEAGAANAGLFAVALLAGTDPAIARKLAAFRAEADERRARDARAAGGVAHRERPSFLPAHGWDSWAADSSAGCSAWPRRAWATRSRCSIPASAVPPAASPTGTFAATIVDPRRLAELAALARAATTEFENVPAARSRSSRARRA